MLRRWFAAGLMLAVSSGWMLPLALKDDIKISLEEKRVEKLSPEGLQLVFYLRIDNVSSSEYTLTGYTYRFVVQEQEYIRLPERTLEPGMQIKPGSAQLIKLPVLVTYANLFNSVDGIRGLSSLSCYIMGEMMFSRGRRRRGGLPFAFSGDFPLYQVPSVAVSAVRAKSLTVGGADLDVEIKITNPNGFSLTVDELEYDLKFGGHPISHGRFRSGGSVNAASHSVLPIPLLFNFFEVGKDVHALLEQETVTCQIYGNLHIQTEWGRLSLPYEINQRVPVLR